VRNLIDQQYLLVDDSRLFPREGGIDEEGILADRRLADRCLAGDVAAWEEFYDQCHDSLLVSIDIMLGPHKSDPNLIDELAARAWYAVVANDGELLEQYDSTRGARLITFLRAVAKGLIGRYFRTERRRRQRERIARRGRPHYHAPELDRTSTAMDEFLESLTPYERGFCGDYLLSDSPDGGDSGEEILGNSASWQVSHRIRQKLLEFLDYDS